MEKVTMKRARKLYAAVVTIPAVYGTDENGNRVLKQKRIRMRNPPTGLSFRDWARTRFASMAPLSPKLARIEKLARIVRG